MSTLKSQARAPFNFMFRIKTQIKVQILKAYKPYISSNSQATQIKLLHGVLGFWGFGGGGGFFVSDYSDSIE